MVQINIQTNCLVQICKTWKYSKSSEWKLEVISIFHSIEFTENNAQNNDDQHSEWYWTIDGGGELNSHLIQSISFEPNFRIS